MNGERCIPAIVEELSVFVNDDDWQMHVEHGTERENVETATRPTKRGYWRQSIEKAHHVDRGGDNFIAGDGG